MSNKLTYTLEQKGGGKVLESIKKITTATANSAKMTKESAAKLKQAASEANKSQKKAEALAAASKKQAEAARKVAEATRKQNKSIKEASAAVAKQNKELKSAASAAERSANSYRKLAVAQTKKTQKIKDANARLQKQTKEYKATARESESLRKKAEKLAASNVKLATKTKLVNAAVTKQNKELKASERAAVKAAKSARSLSVAMTKKTNKIKAANQALMKQTKESKAAARESEALRKKAERLAITNTKVAEKTKLVNAAVTKQNKELKASERAATATAKKMTNLAERMHKAAARAKALVDVTKKENKALKEKARAAESAAKSSQRLAERNKKLAEKTLAANTELKKQNKELKATARQSDAVAKKMRTLAERMHKQAVKAQANMEMTKKLNVQLKEQAKAALQNEKRALGLASKNVKLATKLKLVNTALKTQNKELKTNAKQAAASEKKAMRLAERMHRQGVRAQAVADMTKKLNAQLKQQAANAKKSERAAQQIAKAQIREAAATKKLNARLQAQVAKYQASVAAAKAKIAKMREMSKAQRTVTGSTKRATVAVSHLNTTTISAAGATSVLKGSLLSLASAMQGVALGFGVIGLIRMADEMLRVKNIADGMGIAFETVAEVSRRSQSSLIITAQNISLLKRASDGYGFSLSEVIKITETLQKAMAKTGLEATDMRGVFVGLIDAMTAGELVAGDLEGVFRDSPEVFDIAKEALKRLGVQGIESSEDLTLMADRGELSAQQLMIAFLEASKVMDKEFSEAAQTSRNALSAVATSASQLLFRFDQATSAGSVMGKIILLVAGNADRLQSSLKILGSVLALYFGKKIIWGIVGAFKALAVVWTVLKAKAIALTLVLLRNPLIVAGLAVSVGIIKFTNAVKWLGDAMDELTTRLLKSAEATAVYQLSGEAVAGTTEEMRHRLKYYDDELKKSERWKEKFGKAEEQRAKAAAEAKEKSEKRKRIAIQKTSDKIKKTAKDNAKAAQDQADAEVKAKQHAGNVKKKLTHREVEIAAWGGKTKLEIEREYLEEIVRLELKAQQEKEKMRQKELQQIKDIAAKKKELHQSVEQAVVKGFEATRAIIKNDMSYYSAENVFGTIGNIGGPAGAAAGQTVGAIVDRLFAPQRPTAEAPTVERYAQRRREELLRIGTKRGLEGEGLESFADANFHSERIPVASQAEMLAEVAFARALELGKSHSQAWRKAVEARSSHPSIKRLQEIASGSGWGQGGVSDVITDPAAIEKLATTDAESGEPPAASVFGEAPVFPISPDIEVPSMPEFDISIDDATTSLDTFSESLDTANNLNDERIAQLEKELGIARAQAMLRGSFAESIQRQVVGYSNLPFGDSQADGMRPMRSLHMSASQGGDRTPVTVEIQNIVSPHLVAEQIENGSGKKAVRNLIENDRSFIQDYAL